MNYYQKIYTLLTEGLGKGATQRAIKSMGRGSIEGTPFQTRDDDNPNPKKRGNMLPSKNKSGKYKAHLLRQVTRFKNVAKGA